jgi:hypothetical protein
MLQRPWPGHRTSGAPAGPRGAMDSVEEEAVAKVAVQERCCPPGEGGLREEVGSGCTLRACPCVSGCLLPLPLRPRAEAMPPLQPCSSTSSRGSSSSSSSTTTSNSSSRGSSAEVEEGCLLPDCRCSLARWRPSGCRPAGGSGLSKPGGGPTGREAGGQALERHPRPPGACTSGFRGSGGREDLWRGGGRQDGRG